MSAWGCDIRAWLRRAGAGLVVAAACGVVPVAWAAPGARDTSFDGDGFAVTSLNGGGVWVQPAVSGDGIVAGGEEYGYGPAVARYTSAGQPDTSFDGDGIATLGVPGWQSGGFVLDSANRPVLAGGVSQSKFVAFRYTSSGGLDPQYNGGTAGAIELSGYSSVFVTGAVAVGDAVVVVGHGNPTGGGDTVGLLGRFAAGGGPDPTFNGDGNADGWMTVAVDDEFRPDDVALAPDGKLLVAGTSNGRFAVTRHEANGALDASFDGDGRVITERTGQLSGRAVLADGGRVLVAGSAQGSGEFVVARYLASGAPDTSFNGTGVQARSVPDAASVTVSDLALDGDRLLMAGWTNRPAGTPGDEIIDLFLARLRADGQPDAAYDGDGIVSASAGGHTFGMGLTLAGGRAVIAGQAFDQHTNHQQPFVARFEGDAGRAEEKPAPTPAQPGGKQSPPDSPDFVAARSVTGKDFSPTTMPTLEPFQRVEDQERKLKKALAAKGILANVRIVEAPASAYNLANSGANGRRLGQIAEGETGGQLIGQSPPPKTKLKKPTVDVTLWSFSPAAELAEEREKGCFFTGRSAAETSPWFRGLDLEEVERLAVGLKCPIIETVFRPGASNRASVLSAMGRKGKRGIVVVATRPTIASDLLLVVREEPRNLNAKSLAIGEDWQLTAHAKQENRFVVAVVERATGRFVRGAEVDAYYDGDVVERAKSDRNGDAAFSVLTPDASQDVLLVVSAGEGTGLDGARILGIKKRSGTTFRTPTGRVLTLGKGAWSGTEQALAAAKALPVVPANLGIGNTVSAGGGAALGNVAVAATASVDGTTWNITGEQRGMAVNKDRIVGARPGQILFSGAAGARLAGIRGSLAAAAGPAGVAQLAYRSVATAVYNEIFHAAFDCANAPEEICNQRAQAVLNAALNQASQELDRVNKELGLPFDPAAGNGVGFLDIAMAAPALAGAATRVVGGVDVIAKGAAGGMNLAQRLAFSSLLGSDGGSLVGSDGATLVAAGAGNLVDAAQRLVGSDGGTLLGSDGATLVGLTPASLLGSDGASFVGLGGALISNKGGGLISDKGAGLVALGSGSMVAKGANLMVGGGAPLALRLPDH